jgi:hypothetical protein
LFRCKVYNASVVNFYNATGSLARFENKKNSTLKNALAYYNAGVVAVNLGRLTTHVVLQKGDQAASVLLGSNHKGGALITISVTKNDLEQRSECYKLSHKRDLPRVFFAWNNLLSTRLSKVSSPYSHKFGSLFPKLRNFTQSGHIASIN